MKWRIWMAVGMAAGLWAQVAKDANRNYQTEQGRAGIAGRLAGPDRDARQKPEELMAALGIARGSAVCDVGTGVGYLLPYLSKAVGEQGEVIAQDLFADFLAKAKENAAKAGLKRIRFYQGTERDPGLPEKACDLVLILDAYHHFDYPAEMLGGVKRALKSGGRLAVVDFYKRPGAMGAGTDAVQHIRLDEADVIREVSGLGFALLSRKEHLPGSQYIAMFRVGAAGAKRWSMDEALKVVRVSDPQISPDGEAVVFVASRTNLEENRSDGQLVLARTGDKSQRVLVRERRGVSSPRWSPDGKQIAFLAAVDGKPQVFVLPMDGGDAWQLTKAVNGVQQYAWSPSGDRVAFVTEDEAPKLAGEGRHNRAFEVGHNDYLVQAQPRSSHLWIQSVSGGAAKRMTSGSWTLPKSMPPSSPASPLSWSPTGEAIAFVKVETPYTGDGNLSTIQILEVASGKMRALTGRGKGESQPQISPDGKSVSYWHARSGEAKNVNEIYVAPFEGGEGQAVTRLIDRNIQRAIWMSNAELLVSANDRTSVGLWMQPVKENTAAKRVDMGRVVATAAFWLDASVNAKGQIALTGSEPDRPGEVYWASAAAPAQAPALAKLERLTDFNGWVSGLELGKTETVNWMGADGFPQDGVLTYPPGFAAGKKYPLVLYIHGGPRSASKEAFSPRAQLMAAEGWVVFEPNYRGSDNLGNAYQAAIYNDAGAGPGRDVMSGVAELKKRGWVDESRMAVTGWSYGGYMTTWMIGNYPGIWKAAIAGAPVTDLLDQYNLGDANVRRGASWGGSPWTDAKRMQAAREQSPIYYASKMRTPTLILALTGDYRVTITQSYQLYHALRDQNVPVQFIAYPLPGHSPTDPVHQRDVDRRWIEWLRKYLGA